MGHNRAPKEGNRCCRAGVYFTREEYESIKLAARDRKLSISEFVRSAAAERAETQAKLRASVETEPRTFGDIIPTAAERERFKDVPDPFRREHRPLEWEDEDMQ